MKKFGFFFFFEILKKWKGGGGILKKDSVGKYRNYHQVSLELVLCVYYWNGPSLRLKVTEDVSGQEFREVLKK